MRQNAGAFQYPQYIARGASVREVFLRIDLACDRGMPAVGSHNEARPKHALLTCRPCGSHANNALPVA